ncbi:mitochondrial inner membrane protease subunit 2 isoform X4 [Rhineura floridana]|nr:mitochondrial inner membrane protease subunit 2 isoform X4 [Rhineura floridana]XP_061495955.1 mitochondrial inner membrane protease subunit 2 isoform X4 [Rhineura floridana]XP_061495956.1 mitochondrial inner membrane protease subunit 2 isoform X4 [Rhineura floridana]XP_061495957.1 mitochondrial inner membrane protease subunit 2 isoform X4 [Rhineura floridana]XP_061495958.1 mitochondrial inner membrane protease subunit 2 isoform X4 [Rhineura floridana]XP_061495959.1 mitochondrial inner membr
MMAQTQGFGRRYIKAFLKGFFVAVPVTVTFLDRVACIARVEGASMQPSLNPGGRQVSDVVLLNHWSIRNYEVQRGDIVSLVSPRNPEQKIIKRVIALEGDIIKTIGYKKKYVKVPHGHMWVEGDHHGHSFDSNAFGPNGSPDTMVSAEGPQLQSAVNNWIYKGSLLDFYMLEQPMYSGLQGAGRGYSPRFLRNASLSRMSRTD